MKTQFFLIENVGYSISLIYILLPDIILPDHGPESWSGIITRTLEQPGKQLRRSIYKICTFE